MKRDLKIFKLIDQELARQEEGIELIASENFVSTQVMEAQGSCLTNKYAEGLPGKRYYGGCEIVDQVEQLAIDRAKELFGAAWANVQPHSGAQANAAVMLAVLNPGDKMRFTLIFQGIPKTWNRFSLCEKTLIGDGFVVNDIFKNKSGVYEININ